MYRILVFLMRALGSQYYNSQFYYCTRTVAHRKLYSKSDILFKRFYFVVYVADDWLSIVCRCI